METKKSTQDGTFVKAFCLMLRQTDGNRREAGLLLRDALREIRRRIKRWWR